MLPILESSFQRLLPVLMFFDRNPSEWRFTVAFIFQSIYSNQLRCVNGFPTSDDSLHQQQTQQTFDVQLLRLADPDATNIEAGASKPGPKVCVNFLGFYTP